MFVWLASYPRSGNTLLRTILYRSFGVGTFSLHNDLADLGTDSALGTLVGHRSHGMSDRDFLEMARKTADRVFVKTHGMPEDDDAKAIYVVRDGRAALVSYFHYRRDIAKENVSLEQIVRGDVWGGGWSENVQAWVFSGRPNTLVLRFEDLIARQGEIIERIADFVSLPILERSNIEFSELHAVAPAFFRKGSNESNVAELDADCPRLFWSVHGEAMVRLGYVLSVPDYPAEEISWVAAAPEPKETNRGQPVSRVRGDMRVIYADPGLRDQAGHHMNTCRSLADALRARNIETRLLASADVAPLLQSDLGVLPWFQHSPYLTDNDPICGPAYVFHVGVQTCLQDLLRLTDIGANDVLYIPWAMAAQFCATILWMNGLKSDRRPLVVVNFLQAPEVLLGHRNGNPELILPDYRHEPSAMFLRLAARQAFEDVRMLMDLRYTDPRGAEVLSTILNWSVEPLPRPQHATTGCRRRKAGGQLTVGVLGQQRGLVKGIQHVPAVVRALLASHGSKVRFLIHSSTMPRPLQQILSQLPSEDPRVSVQVGQIDGTEWSRLLDSTDLMLCPYSPDWYRFGTSGVHNEAIANAMPSVVPADTTLSMTAEEFCGSSATFSKADPTSILQAMRHAIDKFDHYSDCAQRGAVKWRYVSGPEKIVDALLMAAKKHGLAC